MLTAFSDSDDAFILFIYEKKTQIIWKRSQNY